MRVGKGKTVLARGRINVKGDAEVLGYRVEEYSFESRKYTPIFCREECEIGVDGDYTIVEKDTIPHTWKKLVEEDWDTLFIYGGTDKGKSTLAAFLVNKICDCYVLDLDIGQSDIAHPAAMGYGYSEGGITARSDIKMVNGFFVGVLSPTGREARCLRGVEKLWRELRKNSGRKVVDTTGWIRGKRAREYKLAKIEIIQPDVIASFEGKPHFLEDYEVFEVEKGCVVERDRWERVKARIESYKSWLESAEIVEVKLSDVKLENTNFMRGKKIAKDFIQDILEREVVFVERGDDFLNICTAERVSVSPDIIKALKELYNVCDICIFSTNDFVDLMIGLYGEKYLGFGLIKEISEDKISILTSVKGRIKRIELGEIKFDGEKEYIVNIP
ncbi:hypothetical protein DRP04_12375 [Archaeoglobales archaeon]|nr:MAG: hypothetical protein DRP04_12375 [Archaeoglobales archaeon]